jgi:hypothetical protein
MVAWNAVSKTPTFGTPGIAFIIASIPVILGGLCNGANGIFSLSAAITASVIRTEPENFSAP